MTIFAADRERQELVPVRDGDAVVNARCIIIDRFLLGTDRNG